VSTKTPSTKAKKPAQKAAGKTAAPKAKAKGAAEDKAEAGQGQVQAKKRGPKATAKPGGARDEAEGEGEGDEEDDEEEFVPKKTGKHAEPTAVDPARGLTPEAKAQINAMVAKGVPLDEALRRAASWETFVAPVKDETQKAFPGKEGGGPRSPFGGRRPSGPRDKSETPREPGSGGSFAGNFDDDDSAGISLQDDEPIVAGGDDD